MREKFLGFLSTKRALKGHTIVNHDFRIGVFLNWLNGREITKDTVQEFFGFLNQKGLKTGTYNAYLATFRLLDLYFDDQDTPKNLLKGYKSKKTDDTEPIKIITIEQVKQLLITPMEYKIKNDKWKPLDDLYLIFTRFLYFSACRVSEAIELKVEHYDPGTHCVWFVNTKTKKRHIYIEDPVLQRSMDELIRNKEPGDYIFTNILGNPINWQTYWDNLKRRCKLVGIPFKVKPHTLRHSQASHLYQAGVALEIVSLILGHANISTTWKTYVHVADDPIKQAQARSPLLQQTTSPRERIKQIKETVEGLKIDTDMRLTDFYKDLMTVFIKYA
jgi:integrase/recombinase XerC